MSEHSSRPLQSRRFRKATIKDVAARSGVSTTTVSNFVSGNEAVCSPETAERIRQAVTALHYVPSSLTRGLHQTASNTVGVCLPNPLDPDVSFGFFFLERMWRGIMAEADEENYALLHYPFSVRESKQCAGFLDGRVDGILLHAEDIDRGTQLAAAGMPVVMLTRFRDMPDGCGSVWADESCTIGLALQHLWDLGHRRIAHIAGPVGSYMGNPDADSRDGGDIAVLRLQSYVAWMRNRQVYDPGLIAYAQAWSAPQSIPYLREWRALDRPPTAIVCANDAQALDLVAAASVLEIRVPDDVSIVGVDNSHEARMSDPPLTTVEVPIDAVGRVAMRALLRYIRGAPVEQCRIALPVTDLVIRGSSAAPRSR